MPRQRFLRAGYLYVPLMPFVLVFMALHFFYKHAQDWHHDRNYLGPRQWDPLALWHFREFNELPHIFGRRVSAPRSAHGGASASPHLEHTLVPPAFLPFPSSRITFLVATNFLPLLPQEKRKKKNRVRSSMLGRRDIPVAFCYFNHERKARVSARD